ncbi:DUF6095 family protein [Flavobacterium sp. SUN052]|uniref:DUF6095 family protein n=1 Tax=Flavobacterium sp. SUN052 TaxID=3002441 RepID=UPI00237E42B0|nr:DUF6095 family protein [Flavobacterium sp. SUN052]MEC4003834.1 DUF6095 family protein [Flavobacterium sp. SUN052]
MATNKDLLAKGVKYLFGALPLMFIGPYIVTLGFMNKGSWAMYVFLGIGIPMTILSMFLAFKGLNLMIKALFDGNQ